MATAAAGSRPTAAEQLREVRDIERAGELVAGEKAYLIEAGWYKDWHLHVSDYYPHRSPEAPDGSIDNAMLLGADQRHRGDLIETNDYCILVKGVWDRLVEWYGGGPEVAVDVVYDETARTQPFPWVAGNCLQDYTTSP